MSEPIKKQLGMDSVLYCGNCLDILPTLAENSVDSVITDPPYHLTSIVKRFGAENAAPAKSNGKTGVYKRSSAGFMGCKWDGGDIAFNPEMWREVLRVLKPGAHLLAFGGTRTYHRMACAIEDAGFEIRDSIAWMYGSGFPKSHDVSKQIDKQAGVKRKVVGSKLGKPGYSLNQMENPGGVAMSGNVDKSLRHPDRECEITAPATDEAKQWQGWGTSLKPGMELIVLARKPLIGTIAKNVLKHGTGALNIDACRVPAEDQRFGSDKPYGFDKRAIKTSGRKYASPSVQRRESAKRTGKAPGQPGKYGPTLTDRTTPERYIEERPGEELGRWPANVIHDGSDEVVDLFPHSTSGSLSPNMNVKASSGWSGGSKADRVKNHFEANSGSAARFFYCVKADTQDRMKGTAHPTVKPVDLIRYLVRLVTPKNGVVLDPFAGTGTTGIAAYREGMSSILIEREREYQENIVKRSRTRWGDSSLFAHIES